MDVHIFILFLKRMLQSFLIIALVLVFFKTTVLSFEQVAGLSMYPTLKTNELYATNKLIYLFHTPARGDIIQAIDPTNGLVIKRVLGLPGETVVIQDGSVFISSDENPDHKVLVLEPYLPGQIKTYVHETSDRAIFTIPADNYFIMGDNRMHSSDSRVYGPVHRTHIVGKFISLQ